ncbi:MAG: exo-alpha-sialidase, partial [Prevotella sp.]
MRTIGKLLLGMALLPPPICAATAKEAGDKGLANEEVVVFDNAHSDIPYRIPALTYTRDGKLIAVCDYRV